MIWLASIIERFRRTFAVVIVALTLAALAGLTRIAYALDPYMQLDSTGPDGAALLQLEQTFGSQMSDCVLLVQGEHVFTPEFLVCSAVGWWDIISLL
jgi:predicted RND superfamily exporter protein